VLLSRLSFRSDSPVFAVHLPRAANPVGSGRNPPKVGDLAWCSGLPLHARVGGGLLAGLLE
jgi:hypothetical protein